MGLMFAQIQDAANGRTDEKYDKGDIRRAWITTWAHERYEVFCRAFRTATAEGRPPCGSRWLHHHDVYL